MKTGTINRASKGQAMTEFVFMAFVAFIVLFVAIQMAALGREYMALGQLNYQVTRWATDPGNNSLKDAVVTRSTVLSAPTWRSSLPARQTKHSPMRPFLPWRAGIWERSDLTIPHAAPRRLAESASR